MIAAEWGLISFSKQGGALWGLGNKCSGLLGEVRRVRQHKRVATGLKGLRGVMCIHFLHRIPPCMPSILLCVGRTTFLRAERPCLAFVWTFRFWVSSLLETLLLWWTCLTCVAWLEQHLRWPQISMHDQPDLWSLASPESLVLMTYGQSRCDVIHPVLLREEHPL